MLIARALVLLALLAAVVCFAVSIQTGDALWRARGVRLVRWTVGAALVFFAVLIAERLADLF